MFNLYECFECFIWNYPVPMPEPPLKKVFYFILFFSPECNAAIHKKCIDKIIGRCTGTAANSRETMVWFVLNKFFFSFYCAMVIKILCAYSFRRNVLRLTCHIDLRPTTTWAPPFVTIVAVCCGVLSNRASNVRVRILCVDEDVYVLKHCSFKHLLFRNT